MNSRPIADKLLENVRVAVEEAYDDIVKQLTEEDPILRQRELQRWIRSLGTCCGWDYATQGGQYMSKSEEWLTDIARDRNALP